MTDYTNKALKVLFLIALGVAVGFTTTKAFSKEIWGEEVGAVVHPIPMTHAHGPSKCSPVPPELNAQQIFEVMQEQIRKVASNFIMEGTDRPAIEFLEWEYYVEGGSFIRTRIYNHYYDAYIEHLWTDDMYCIRSFEKKDKPNLGKGES